MKTLFVILLALLLFAGCESSVESEDEITVEGIIFALETPTYGTHKLVDGHANILYILSSDKVDLNFHNREVVTITGMVKHVSLPTQLIIVSEVEGTGTTVK